MIHTLCIFSKHPVIVAFFVLFLAACASKKEKIAKKWKVKQATIAGETLTNELVEGFYLDLIPNGSYELVGMDVEKGTWTLNKIEDSLLFSNEKGRKSSAKILYLSDTECRLFYMSEDTPTELYFMAYQ